MPAEAPLRLIKNCRLYQERETCNAKRHIPHVTRGLYILYKEGIGREARILKSHI